MSALQREAAWAEERLFGDLRQSVPQNGRVHLLGIESPFPDQGRCGSGWDGPVAGSPESLDFEGPQERARSLLRFSRAAPAGFRGRSFAP